MERPSMNPMSMEEAEHAAEPATGWQFPGVVVGRIACWVRWWWALLWSSPITLVTGRRSQFRNEDGSPTKRFMRGLGYRAAFVPLLLSAAAVGAVWVGTHPWGVAPENDPLSAGLYFEAFTYSGARNNPSEGWLVPVIDARKVLLNRNRIYDKRYPAVVLMHDFGATRDQLLPLIRPLHDQGMVVLALASRGDAGFGNRGATFGIHEAEDLRLAVQALRNRAFVDADRIGVLGIGTGGIAAVLAAEADPGLKALVLAATPRQAEDVLREHIVPGRWYFQWMSPLCKWAFEISYGVDADAIDEGRFAGILKERSTLVLPETKELEAQLLARALPFLSEKLTAAEGPAAASVADTK